MEGACDYNLHSVCTPDLQNLYGGGKRLLGRGQMHLGMLGLANFEAAYWIEEHAVGLGDQTV